MKTEEMSREDLTAGLAKKLKMRKDGIEALELDMDTLRVDFDRVKQSNYWASGYYSSFLVFGATPIIWGTSGYEAGLAALATGGAIAYACGRKKDEDDTVKNELKRQIQTDLVNLDAQVVTRLKVRDISESEKDLAEITGIHDEAIAACEIDETRLTNMYNKVSKGEKVEKWAVPAAFASLVASVVAGFGLENKVAEMAGILGFLACAGTLGVQAFKELRVKNQLQDAVTDRLIELKTQDRAAPKPTNM